MRIDASATSKKELISIVVPVYNEEKVLPEFHRRMSVVLDSMSVGAEIIYVNDGSADSTLKVIHGLKREDSRVAILDLSRNFGKEIAMSAGLDHTQGDKVVVIDADLQDPPELIPELISYLDNGYDVSYAKRVVRNGESFLKKITADLFYRIMQIFGRVQIPRNTGDYRAMNRRVVDSLKQLHEQHRFMKGLFTWVGYQQKAVPYHRDPRYSGKTKWNYWHLWNFALEGITSYTAAPLKIATYLGIMTASGAFCYGLYIIIKTLIYGDPVRGYPSLMAAVLFFGGVHLIFVGILGEYLGRTFDESKRRPLYFVKDYESAAKLEIKDSNQDNTELVGESA